MEIGVGTGAGKTISFIIASREIDSRANSCYMSKLNCFPIRRRHIRCISRQLGSFKL